MQKLKVGLKKGCRKIKLEGHHLKKREVDLLGR